MSFSVEFKFYLILHMVQPMPLPPPSSCFTKIQIGLTFLVPAYPACPVKEAVKWVFVCLIINYTNQLTEQKCLQCFGAVVWAAGKASGL